MGTGSDRTNIASEIRSLEDFNAQILLDPAYNLHSIVEVEMCVLIKNPLSAILNLSVRILFSSFPDLPPLSICTIPVCPASESCLAHPSLTGLGWDSLTLFKCTLMLPLASMVAVSPRSDTTLPRTRTVWLVKESRYLALTRGVASEVMGGRSVRERDGVIQRHGNFRMLSKCWGMHASKCCS